MQSKLHRNKYIYDLIKNKIDFNYNNSDSIAENIRLIEKLGRFAWRNHAGCFYDAEIENLLFDYGKKVSEIEITDELDKITSSQISAPGINKKHTLHVATELGAAGGHTRVIEQFINRNNNYSQTLLLTRQNLSSIPQWFVNNTRTSTEYFSLNTLKDPFQKAYALRTIGSKFDKIILYHHPYDIIPILAFSHNFNIPVILLNHANSWFWFGLTVVDIILCQTQFHMKFTEKYRNTKKCFYLPISQLKETIEEPTDKKKEIAKRHLNFPKDSKIILSVGTREKFIPNAEYNYFEIANKILARYKNTIIIIVGVSASDPLASKLANSSRVYFFKHIDDLKEFYLASDICLEVMPQPSLGVQFHAPVIGLSCPFPRFGKVKVFKTHILDRSDLYSQFFNKEMSEERFYQKLGILLEDDKRRLMIANDIRNNVLKSRSDSVVRKSLKELEKKIKNTSHNPAHLDETVFYEDEENVEIADRSEFQSFNELVHYWKNEITKQEYMELIKNFDNQTSKDFVIEEKTQTPKPNLIAFYLPQYHPIPENDKWWGKGFTEWTNVISAKPLFDGHYQPRIPLDLGYYDLREIETQEQQAKLAQQYGISGFCYYHYWFNGKRLLNKPLDNILKYRKPDFPFCLCWANEDWTRSWDGRTGEILIEQHYSDEDDLMHIQFLIRLFQDPRYIRIDGKPLFLVYRASRLPNPLRTTKIWREEARRLGVGEIYLCRVESFETEKTNPLGIGFDAAIEFQPDWENLGPPNRENELCRVFDYPTVIKRMLAKPRVSYPRYFCVTPSWDNSPRRKSLCSTVLHNSTPSYYQNWLIETLRKSEGKAPLVFINAWNEWGEGAYLEPDQKYGREYLLATKKALDIYKNIGNISHKKNLNDTSEIPRISIIIPLYNNLQFTHQCLKSILQNTQYPNYEIIFVDNGSTDGTREYLQRLNQSKIKVLQFDKNLGFTVGCNRGAQIASGQYILFLNNDTEVQQGWLSSLVQLAETRSDCGAVGSKLIYPDGSLQEAGSIIFSDGNGWNYGRGHNPTDPRFCFVRKVDYCSAASLLIKKDVWLKIGGFDEQYAPAYYEDTDLCFAIRELGYHVYFQPASIVIHHEGKTAGNDITKGLKKYQQINHVKFLSKWKNQMADQYKNKPSNVVMASERNIKGSILVVDPFLPLYDRASGSLRLFNMLQLMKQIGYHVSFIARDGSMEEKYKPELQQIGIETYSWDVAAMRAAGVDMKDLANNINYEILFRDRRFDLAVVAFWEVAEWYIPIIRRFSPNTRILLDTIDIHFLREIREAELEKDKHKMKKALKRKKRELSIYSQADALITVTDEDRKVLKKYISDKPMFIIPNIHPIPEKTLPYKSRRDILFVGNFNHLPNRDGIKYFIKEVWDKVKASLPHVQLYVVGNNPPPEIQALSSDQIHVTGYVEDLKPYLLNARVSISPLRYGAGMKGKVGEALSYGLPVVTTTIGAEGMNLKHGKEVMIADDPHSFAKHVIRLYNDETLWEALSLNGYNCVKTRWSPAQIKQKLHQLLETNNTLVSIIMLTYNALSYTKKCIQSVMGNTLIPYELIIVDNNSSDGTKDYIRTLEKEYDNVRVIYNKNNVGFAAGNNQGLERARGEYIILLNNDVLVGSGWLKRMVDCLEMDPSIGLVGPLSNRVSGWQRVNPVPYKEPEDFEKYDREVAQINEGKYTPRNRIAGFAMLMRRKVYEAVGGLDESFGSGNYEDDDYCVRVRNAGFAIMVAENVFIHHFGSVSFTENNIHYEKSIAKNRKKFEAKWPQVSLAELMEDTERVVDRHKRLNKNALYHFRQGELTAAEAILREVLVCNPLDDTALLISSMINHQKGEIVSALEQVKKLLKINPKNGGAYHQMAIIVQSGGDEKKAETLLALANKRDPAYREKYAEIFNISQ